MQTPSVNGGEPRRTRPPGRLLCVSGRSRAGWSLERAVGLSVVLGRSLSRPPRLLCGALRMPRNGGQRNAVCCAEKCVISGCAMSGLATVKRVWLGVAGVLFVALILLGTFAASAGASIVSVSEPRYTKGTTNSWWYSYQQPTGASGYYVVFKLNGVQVDSTYGHSLAQAGQVWDNQSGLQSGTLYDMCATSIQRAARLDGVHDHDDGQLDAVRVHERGRYRHVHHQPGDEPRHRVLRFDQSSLAGGEHVRLLAQERQYSLDRVPERARAERRIPVRSGLLDAVSSSIACHRQ